MRIFAKFEDVGSEYETLAPVKISAAPFDGECYYLDLEGGKIYYSIKEEGGKEAEGWKIYNGKKYLGEFLVKPKTGEYIGSRIVETCYDGLNSYVRLEDGEEIPLDDNLETYNGYENEWYLYQDYSNGKPIGEPYWK